MNVHPRIDPSERRTIQGWREYLLMTQTELGQKVGVSKNAVYNWEHLKRSPRIKLRRAVAEVFADYGVQIEQIIWPAEERGVANDQRHAS